MAENSKKSNEEKTTEETSPTKICLVMMPFSDPEGYAPGHFRKVFEQIIKPAINKAGYKEYRVDEDSVSDLITTKIFQAIHDCEMAVCDLSSRNPNVLYELGIRHSFDKPVVLITDDKTERIFDIQGISTITYRSSRLYDEVPEDQTKITEAIKANENNSSGYSILNMIKLQKATYDANIKDTDSPEISNALLMRIVNALEKKEQKQNYFDKLYNGQYTFVDIPGTEKVQEGITQLKLKLTEINDDVDNLDLSNITLEDLNEIEKEILEIKKITTTFKINNFNLLTIRQELTLDNCFDTIESIFNKIQKIKANFNNS